MKCRVCKEPAVIDVRRHNAAFCRDHFLHHCDEQVQRAIESHRMLAPGERVLVAVSGGKDSLALWDILVRLGYEADGLYLGLGIGEYSDESVTYRASTHARIGRPLLEIDLARRLRLRHPRRGRGHPPGSLRRVRALEATPVQLRRLENGYDGRRHRPQPRRRSRGAARQRAALGDRRTSGRQHPVLPAAPGFVRKVKPLVRLGERETAAYCVLRGIDYQVEECPMAAGNRHLGYKEMLNTLEERSPGTKAAFLFGFLERGHERFAADAGVERDELRACTVCGAPTPGEVCAFCRLREKATVVPVKLGR